MQAQQNAQNATVNQGGCTFVELIFRVQGQLLRFEVSISLRDALRLPRVADNVAALLDDCLRVDGDEDYSDGDHEQKPLLKE